MLEIISCPTCQRRLRLPAEHIGQTVQCPACQTTFLWQQRSPDAPLLAAVVTSPDEEQPPAPRGSRPSPPPAGGLPPRPLAVPAQRKSSTGRAWLIALGIIGGTIVVGLLVLGGFRWYLEWWFPPASTAKIRKPPAPPPPILLPAGREPGELRDNEITEGMNQLVHSMDVAFRSANPDSILAHFDLDRTVEEVLQSGAVSPLAAHEKPAFTLAMKQAMRRATRDYAANMQWTSFKITHIRKLPGGELAVIIRHTATARGSWPMRWWITCREGRYRAYDLESLPTSRRISAIAGTLAAGEVGHVPRSASAITAITEAMAATAEARDLEEAKKKLRDTAAVAVPPRWDAQRHASLALLHLYRGKSQQSLDEVAKARGIQPDMPWLDFTAGLAYNQLADGPHALEYLEKYRDITGEDGVICRLIGDALRHSSRFPEAAKSYRRALDFDPKDHGAFQGLLRAIAPADNTDDIAARFVRLDNRQANFDLFAADCEQRDFPALLELLVDTMATVDPRYPPVDLYRALLQARAGHPEKALTLFRSVLDRQPDPAVRQEYGRRFLHGMVSARQFAGVYAAAPDPREAFRVLAPGMLKNARIEELRQLVIDHGKKYPKEPLLPLYQAEVYVQQERYSLAEKAFTAAIAGRPDEELLKLFHRSRVLARSHTAGALAAYRDLPPRHETFSVLAAQLNQDENDDQLQALLDAHAKNDPDSTTILSYRCRLHLRKNRVAEAIADFKAALDRQPDRQKRATLLSELLSEFAAVGKAVEGYRAAPNAREAFRILAEELEDLSPQDLPQLMAAHREKDPADPLLAEREGYRLLDEKAWDKATDVFARALQGAPQGLHGQLQIGYLTARYRAGQALQAYETTAPRSETFEILAGLMADDGKGAELEALTKAHAPHAADSPDLFFYQGLAQLLLNKPAEAAALIQKALDRQPVDHLRVLYLTHLLPMPGRSWTWTIDAYRVWPDKALAFDRMASTLLYLKRDKDLAALLAEHGKSRAIELPVLRYQGELHLLRSEFNQAALQFGIALTVASPADKWPLRNGYFRACVKLGNAVAAYKDDPGHQTFETLAGLCVAEKSARQLRALIDAHRKTYPEDTGLAGWELDTRWLEQDYAAALKLLQDNRDDLFALPRYRWKATSYLVRCLVKLKRPADAIAEAEKPRVNSTNPLLPVLAHATAGDVPKTIALVAQAKPHSLLPATCYQDLDLGPILQSEPFRAFRDKFPPPKPAPAMP
jgi:tetratricopeptide (TPR) repeat protein